MSHSHRDRAASFAAPGGVLQENLRAVGLILLGGVALLATLALILVAYVQAGRIAGSVAWPAGIFSGSLLSLIILLFAAGYRAFAHMFRASAVALAILCVWSASYFVSEPSGIFRNLGTVFVLLATVPFIAFYRLTFNAGVRAYLSRRRWARDHMR